MTKVDKIKEVRQLRFVEGVPIREICRRVQLARNTVKRILRSNKTEYTYQRTNTYQPVTGSIQNIVKEWIKEDLAKKKKHRRTATRIFEILRNEHGYVGSYVAIAKKVREIRNEEKKPDNEAYIPLIFSPGEAFQFDWGEMPAYINGELVTLQLAVILLCHSRHFYLRAYRCQKQELMLDAQQRAFEYFGGVCKRGIYDNLTTAVKKILKGHHRNLQEKFIRFCSHYLFEPNFCSPAKGNEKGRVENKIGYVRRNFFIPIPSYNSIEELNDRLISFSIGQSRAKKHPELRDKTCYEVYEKERDVLIQLPGYNFECSRTQHATVTPLCTAAFDNNKYSVPLEFKDKIVLVKGGAEEVSLVYDGKEIARHKRLYGVMQHSLNPYHYLSVLARKPGAFRNGLPFRNWSLPAIFNEYRQLLSEKYADSDLYFAKTLVLLKDWPLLEVIEAIKKSISLGILGDSYILRLLRQKDDPVVEKEYISIRIELERYTAKQREPDYYDEVLRFRKEVKSI
jgi:transposase